MRKPVLHVILYLRAYLPQLESPVNICLKPEEGKAHTPQYPGYLVPTGPAAATPFRAAPAVALVAVICLGVTVEAEPPGWNELK